MAYVAVKPSYDADVIIAGAGPAGAAAACRLARSGASVFLLDRVTFPRDKVCGDFVGPSALVELDSLGVARMDGYARTNIARRAALYIDGEELISRPFPEIEGMPSHGRVIPSARRPRGTPSRASRIFLSCILPSCRTGWNGC
jgi:menaquinone-9 beta-reductase